MKLLWCGGEGSSPFTIDPGWRQASQVTGGVGGKTAILVAAVESEWFATCCEEGGFPCSAANRRESSSHDPVMDIDMETNALFLYAPLHDETNPKYDDGFKSAVTAVESQVTGAGGRRGNPVCRPGRRTYDGCRFSGNGQVG